MPINYPKELNKEQLEVVENGDGPCLVLAGAGSGKTRTLVYRVAYLIEKGVKPLNILLVTFTNKASREMLDRVTLLLRKNPQGLWGGTFHRIGHRVLRTFHSVAGLSPNFSIIDKEDAKTLIRSCIGELNINTKTYSQNNFHNSHPSSRQLYLKKSSKYPDTIQSFSNKPDANLNATSKDYFANESKEKKFPKVDVLLSLFSYSANAQKTLEDVIDSRYFYMPEMIKNDILRIYDFYTQKKRTNSLLDFDDLLTRWLELLEKDPRVKKRLSEQFKYILVDEYQDTNKVQSKIIYHLASVHNNVLVVGDDSQSIYSFRAADVTNILEFPKVFEAARMYKLERNYRSTPPILNLANQSIKHNQNQFDKTLKPVKDRGSLPRFVSTSDGYAQSRFVADTVLEHTDEGVDLRNIGVLFRAMYQTIELELELNKRGIPYQVRGGLRFFEQAHIKDVLAYLRILYNFHDELAWKRVLHLLPGVGPATADKIWIRIVQIQKIEDLEGILSGLPARSQESVRQLILLVQKLYDKLSRDTPKQQHIAPLVKIILKSGYELYAKDAFEDAQDRLEDVVQMGSFSKNYASLEKFLADAALTEGFKGERRAGDTQTDDKDTLILSTIHQAKGLEWNTVFVIGLAEGQFPHHKVYDKPQEMEEERRLFYVAATRAKENLYLTFPIMNHSRYTSNHFNHPSTFIDELPENVYEIRRLGRDLKEMPLGNSILDRVLEQRHSPLSDLSELPEELEYVEE